MDREPTPDPNKAPNRPDASMLHLIVLLVVAGLVGAAFLILAGVLKDVVIPS